MNEVHFFVCDVQSVAPSSFWRFLPLRYLNPARKHCGSSVARDTICKSTKKQAKQSEGTNSKVLSSGCCVRSLRGVKESRAAQSFVFKGCRTTKGYLVDVRHPSVSRSVELPFSIGSPVHAPQEGTTRDTNKSASGWSRDVEDGTEEAGCVLQVPHPSVSLLQGTPLLPHA